jgi:hypothetical protein
MLPYWTPDIKRVVRRLLELASDGRERTLIEGLLREDAPACVAADEEAGQYLLRRAAFLKEDSLQPEYFFFVDGRLLVVRRLGTFSNKFSFIRYPPERESLRQSDCARFAELGRDEFLGWFDGPWAALTDDQKAICGAVFVADDAPPAYM